MCRRFDSHLEVGYCFENWKREENKKLLAEAKKQESEDKSGKYIFRVRGPPWSRRIVKLEKKDANQNEPINPTQPGRVNQDPTQPMQPDPNVETVPEATGGVPKNL